MNRRPASVASRAARIWAPGATECLPQRRVGLHRLLQLPQALDGVPVAVLGRVLQPAEELLVDAAPDALDGLAELDRRRQLGEVQHPVDLPVPVVDVHGVLEQHRELHAAHLVGAVELALEVLEVAQHLRHQPVPPPVGEPLPVDRQHAVEVRADRGRVLRVLGDTRHVPRAVLAGAHPQVRVGRDGRGVEVAVDVLGQPVDGERRPEPAEHVVAGQPPATDVEVHRAERVRAVQVVVDPEEVLLLVGLPGHRELVLTQVLSQDRVVAAHHRFLPTAEPARPAHCARPPEHVGRPRSEQPSIIDEKLRAACGTVKKRRATPPPDGSPAPAPGCPATGTAGAS